MTWRLLDRITEVTTPWIELVGERWLDDTGKALDYWRVVAADSVIVVTEHAGSFLLPEPSFRPGVGRRTLDFPGGRLARDADARATAHAVLARELGVREDGVVEMLPLTSAPLEVNSSASNQRLHGFIARLDPGLDRTLLLPHRAYSAKEPAELLAELSCLQCRALLLEALRQAKP
ncbi:hypothetical protein [Jiella mangrovi]|uniref:NUDIX hydrolase n=1 Tax=Jiella mangrovi TaxID=2821407 RepID=A0ABS4BLZ7_9HYPH|nr:hypothetical protein [Jiella mangrovi]MBP0617180.1 hypothetical protein [Jiella mangrovi]